MMYILFLKFALYFHDEKNKNTPRFGMCSYKTGDDYVVIFEMKLIKNHLNGKSLAELLNF